MSGEKPLWKTAGGLSAIAAFVTAVGTLIPVMLNLAGDSPVTAGSGAPPTEPAHGIVLVVTNGSSSEGIATVMSNRLEDAGYVLKEPGFASETIARTEIYYGIGLANAAKRLKQNFFPNATLRRATSPLPQGANIEIVLGEDIDVPAPVLPSPAPSR